MKGYRIVLEKSWVSENFRPVSKSRRRKLESRNFELAKNKAGLLISNCEISVSGSRKDRKPSESLISMNRHKTTATTTAEKRATERKTNVVIVLRWGFYIVSVFDFE